MTPDNRTAGGVDRPLLLRGAARKAGLASWAATATTASSSRLLARGVWARSTVPTLRQDRGAGNDCPSWSRSHPTAREGAQRAAGASERDARTRAADDPAAARALRAIEPLVLRRRLRGSRGLRVRAREHAGARKRAAASWAAAGPGRQNAKVFVCITRGSLDARWTTASGARCLGRPANCR